MRDHSNMLATVSYQNNNNAVNSLKHSSDAFKFVNNLLTNHSFEDGSTDWTTYIAGSVTYTSSNDTSQHYLGANSRKLTLSSEGGVMVNQDNQNVIAGKTYTVSAFTKITQLTSGRVGVLVEMKNGDTILNSVRTTEMNYANNTWDRLQITFTVPSNATYIRIFPYMYATTGTVYFDCIQLEQAGAAGRYNLLQNSGFGTDSAPSLSSWAATSGVVANSNSSSGFASGAKFTGSPGATRTLSQTVSLGSSSKSRTLVFGGMAKGFSSAMCNDDGNSRRFGIKLELYEGTTLNSTKTALYNAQAINTLQSISSAVTAGTNITSIKIVLMFNYEVNTAYFDNIYVYIDNYGTEYTYDSNGRLTVEKNNAGDSLHYTYSGPDITKITFKKDNVEKDNETYTYDAHHNVLTATTKTGIKTTYTYPSTNKGLPTTIKVENSGGTMTSSVSYGYDSTGNYVTSEQDARGNTTTYVYNYSKDLLTSVTDRNGNTTSYTYNANTDELTKTTGAITGSTNASVSYQYNSFGSISSITHNGFKYNFAYDVFGRPTQTSVGSQALCTYTYNTDGTLQAAAYGNGTTHTYTYDSLDRVTSESYNGTKAFSYSYGADGALGSYVDHANSISANFSYDLVGRVTDINYSDKTKIHYAYNAQGNTSSYYVKKSSSTISSASYTYSSDGLPLTTTLGNTEYPSYEYTYDGLNRQTELAHTVNGDIVSTKYTYLNGASGKKTGLVSILQYRYDGYNFGPHDDYQYTYDNNGNIATVKDGTTQISYQYDGLNRLIRENNQQLNKTITYTYDNGGNILNKKYYAYTTGTLGTATQTINYTYDSAWKDKLLTYNGGATITYDAIGNPLSYRGYTFTWQKGRQLATAKVGSTTYKYTYDVNGQRIKKVAGSTTTNYSYVSGLLVSQTDGTNNLYFRYDANGVARSVKFNGTDYYYLYNLQGDVITIYDKGGNPKVHYKYDSWGKITATTGALASTLGALNPFRYRGYVYDAETGFYCLQSRYYDPETGRFINADGYITTGTGITSFNMFAYCLDNPIMYIDDTGTCACKYDGSACDFRRLEAGLPPIACKHQNDEMFLFSKKRTDRPDSGFRDLPDDEISKRARDKSLPGKERKKYQEEEKVRGLRNKQKRQKPFSLENISSASILVGVSITAGAAIVFLLADDLTGVGFENDCYIDVIIEWARETIDSLPWDRSFLNAY